MKITKRQLRQLIAEAMFNPRAAFKGAKDRFAADASDKDRQQAFSLVDSPDNEAQRQGHDLIDMLGDYDSPSGDSYLDIASEDEAAKLAAFENALDNLFGNDKRYLNKDFKEALFSIFDQNATLSGNRGFRFSTPQKSNILSTDMLYLAAMNIYKKGHNPKVNYRLWNDSTTKILESLIVKVIMLTRVTRFDSEDLEESGLGDYSGPEKIHIWNDEIKKVVDSGKLVVFNPFTGRPMQAV